MIWYRNGSADDPPGKSGIAHFLEHLMFKGTHKHPKGAFSEAVAEIGGQENAFTSNDYTAYFQRVAKEHLGLMMAYEAGPHEKPDAERRRRRPRTRRGDGGAAHALRRRPRRAAQRGRAGGDLHPSSLWQADHRLGPRDRDARSFGRPRLLRPLLHARERHPDRRRRRDEGRGDTPRRGALRPDSPAWRAPGAAPSPRAQARRQNAR